MSAQSPLTVKVFSSISDVPKDTWNGLVSQHSVAFSYEFWQVLEESQLNDFTYQYAVFFASDGAAVALASFYSIATDLAIFAPARLRKILAGIRRVFPHFLTLSMLECGTPVTLNSPPFISSGRIPSADIIAALDRLLTATAKAESKLLIVIRDIEPESRSIEPHFAGLGYCLMESLPNTYMDIPWCDTASYVRSMKSYYRCKLLKHLRRNEPNGIRHELLEDFGEFAELLCAQWLVVHGKADEFQREVLTPAFYRAFSERMGSRSKVIVFYQQDVIVGHVLLLMDGELLRWLYFGREKAHNDSLYLYAGHKVIEAAIMLGAKRLEMGLTTYPIKQDLGAQVTPIKLAIKSPRRFINPLVKILYPLMNHIPHFENKCIFKSVDTGKKPQKHTAMGE